MRSLPSYEKQGKAKRVVKAQQVWYAIIESQTETGTPYILYKDACNRKSNQQNLGTIKCSNLCTEIVEYTSKDEVGGVTPAQAPYFTLTVYYTSSLITMVSVSLIIRYFILLLLV